MQRRALLTAFGGSLSLAGCLGSQSQPATDAPATDAPPTDTRSTVQTTDERSTAQTTDPHLTNETTTTGTTPTDSFPYEISVAGVDDAPLRRTFDVTVDVSVDGSITAGETATVTVSLRTTTDSAQSLTYQQAECARNEFRAMTDGYGLYLFPADGDWTGDTDCPVVSSPNLHCGIPVVEETVTVPATGSLTWQYDVLVPPENHEQGSCVHPARYDFSRQFTADDQRATLSFELSVRDTDR